MSGKEDYKSCTHCHTVAVSMNRRFAGSYRSDDAHGGVNLPAKTLYDDGDWFSFDTFVGFFQFVIFLVPFGDFPNNFGRRFVVDFSDC